MIKRYDFTEHGRYDDELYHTMDEHEQGEYVRYEDIEHLLAKSPEDGSMKIEEFFLNMRFDPKQHLGLGDIRLTIGQQEEIIKSFRALQQEPITQPHNSIYPRVSDAAYSLIGEYKQKIVGAVDHHFLIREKAAITGLLFEFSNKLSREHSPANQSQPEPQRASNEH